MDRVKFNKVWLLFVVFATGLVWTWSQVGQRQSEQAKLQGGESFELLQVEAGCDLAIAPCAAYAGQLALVASARVEGDGIRWQLKALGEGLPALPVLQLSLLLPGAAAQSLQVLRVGDEWQAYSAGLVQKGSILRARLDGGAQPWIADFPLTGKR
jgi:hypothetical protein